MSGSSSSSSGGTNEEVSDSLLAEWATSLCQHLQTHRSSAPISVVLPRLLGPAVERHLRSIIESAVKIQRRGKRSTLSVDDINFALELAKEEVGAIFIYIFWLRFVFLGVGEDICEHVKII
jgi:hypothetical protein